MFRASASITGSINIWLSTLLSTHALSIRFRFKAQSYELKMFLNSLKRGSCSLFEKLRIKPITRIVHTTSMQKSLMTSSKIHSLPTNNSVDNNFQASWATSIYNNEPVVDNQYPLRNKIRKLLLRFQTKNDNLFESVEIPTISWNLYPSFINSEHNEIWILETS